MSLFTYPINDLSPLGRITLVETDDPQPLFKQADKRVVLQVRPLPRVSPKKVMPYIPPPPPLPENHLFDTDYASPPSHVIPKEDEEGLERMTIGCMGLLCCCLFPMKST